MSGLLLTHIPKAGLLQLTQTLALELSAHGIRVVGVSPGMTDTDALIQGARRTAAVSTHGADTAEQYPDRPRLGQSASIQPPNCSQDCFP